MGSYLITLAFWFFFCLVVAWLAKALQRSPLIGGHVQFVQNSHFDQLSKDRSFPKGLQWPFFASYAGAQVMLGDAGVLYILAGWNKRTAEWHWHGEWDCF